MHTFILVKTSMESSECILFKSELNFHYVSTYTERIESKRIRHFGVIRTQLQNSEELHS